MGCHPCPWNLLHASSMLAGSVPNGTDVFALRAARSTTEQTAVTLEQTAAITTGMGTGVTIGMYKQTTVIASGDRLKRIFNVGDKQEEETIRRSPFY